MNYDLTSFEKGLEQLSITLSGEQKQQFLTYYEYLVEKNKVMNLTAITEYEEVITKHFLDSLAVVKTSCFKPEKLAGKRLIDIGTGAGFPGIPLKIVFPEMEILLLDSLNKRINFLNEVTEMLGLTKINTVHGRAEDYAKQKGYRESFDFCVSRAVANLSTLSEYCIPFVKQGGCFISYKSGSVDQELIQAEKAVKILGGQREEVVRFSLADTDMDRSFVVIRKAKPTPKKYPRKAGLPSKEPLGAVILS
ncbi:MAG: 16S rRNA (guanine(527)-N(7))-methyltransferase RsmG [Blautia glucerasea]|nr:16S rRNA (guanine(527)-N(7))-methyltransferase RsmG [Blautia glucerasea]MDY3085924.1 16S rRNA (guanine(527)-N(7))-methyltransferase RsmG [Blautia sp.]